MKVMIGVDPHKRSHTATMLDRHEHELRRITVRSGDRQVAELLKWVDGVKPRMWAVESAGGWATCSPSSWSRLARPCSMCRRCWPRGCVCSVQVSRPRAIRTMPARSPSLRYGRRRWRRSSVPITPRCAGCWPSTTPMSLAGGPSSAAGCTPSSTRWCLAGSARKWSSTGTISARRRRLRRRCSRRASPSGARARRRHRSARRRAGRVAVSDHRRGGGVGDDVDGDLRGRPDRRRDAHRVQRRPDPVHHRAATPPIPAPHRSSSPPAGALPTGCDGAATAG